MPGDYHGWAVIFGHSHIPLFEAEVERIVEDDRYRIDVLTQISDGAFMSWLPAGEARP
jgi:hypothetical protein